MALVSCKIQVWGLLNLSPSCKVALRPSNRLWGKEGPQYTIGKPTVFQQHSCLALLRKRLNLLLDRFHPSVLSLGKCLVGRVWGWTLLVQNWVAQAHCGTKCSSVAGKKQVPPEGVTKQTTDRYLILSLSRFSFQWREARDCRKAATGRPSYGNCMSLDSLAWLWSSCS